MQSEHIDCITVFVLLLPLVMMIEGCGGTTDARQDFTIRMQKVSVGMTKGEVEQVLGVPDVKMVAPEKFFITAWPDGASEYWAWRYQKNSDDLIGGVMFDKNGQVMDVYVNGNSVALDGD